MVRIRPIEQRNCRATAVFSLRVLGHCPHCGVVGESYDAIAMGNCWMDSHLRLATLCEDCGGWSMIDGSCTLRRPNQDEGRELLRDYRSSLAWTEWRLRAGIADGTHRAVEPIPP